MFLLLFKGYQHNIPKQSSINLGETFLWIIHKLYKKPRRPKSWWSCLDINCLSYPRFLFSFIIFLMVWHWKPATNRKFRYPWQCLLAIFNLTQTALVETYNIRVCEPSTLQLSLCNISQKGIFSKSFSPILQIEKKTNLMVMKVTVELNDIPIIVNLR